jgi:hypothetical protein
MVLHPRRACNYTDGWMVGWSAVARGEPDEVCIGYVLAIFAALSGADERSIRDHLRPNPRAAFEAGSRHLWRRRAEASIGCVAAPSRPLEPLEDEEEVEVRATWSTDVSVEGRGAAVAEVEHSAEASVRLEARAPVIYRARAEVRGGIVVHASAPFVVWAFSKRPIYYGVYGKPGKPRAAKAGPSKGKSRKGKSSKGGKGGKGKR